MRSRGVKNGRGSASLSKRVDEVGAPYVIVVQHDRNFVREAPIVQIVKMFRKERRLAEVCPVTYDDGPELPSIRAIEVSVANSAATHRFWIFSDTIATMVR